MLVHVVSFLSPRVRFFFLDSAEFFLLQDENILATNISCRGRGDLAVLYYRKHPCLSEIDLFSI